MANFEELVNLSQQNMLNNEGKIYTHGDLTYNQRIDEIHFEYFSNTLGNEKDVEIYFLVKKFLKERPVGKKNNYMKSIYCKKKENVIFKALLELGHPINTKTEFIETIFDLRYNSRNRCIKILIQYGGLIYASKKDFLDIITEDKRTYAESIDLIENFTVYDLKVILVRKIYDDKLPLPKNYPKLLLQLK